MAAVTQAASPAMTYQQSHVLVGVTCMLLVLCLAAVGGRLMARRVSRLRLEADDWICVAALVMFVGLCIEQILLAHYGSLMLSQTPPSIGVLHIFGRAEFASQITYTFVTCAAKVSLLMLYRRIFSLRVKWFRIAWWANIGLVAALLITLVIVNCLQCKPLSAVWNNPMSCMPDRTSTSSLGFVNAVIDLAILILPLPIVWSLQMAYKQKIAICGVFSLGLIGVAISLARAIAVANPDFLKGGGLAFILWSTTEPAVGLICSSLPVLRPLYTTGLTKLGSSREWNWYAPKRWRYFGPSADSSSRYKDKSNSAGSTLQSALISKGSDDKSWLTIMETEMAGPYEDMKSSQISPVEKSLPPAYVPRQQEDTGYHTWNLNPLITPQSLLRVGNSTLVAGGKNDKGERFSPCLNTHTRILNEDRTPNVHFGQWHPPSRTANTPTSRWRSSPESPESGVDRWTSPSLAATKNFSQRNVLRPTIPPSSNDSLTVSSRTRAIACMESSERRGLPQLRPHDSLLPTPASPPILVSPNSQTDLTRDMRHGAFHLAVAETLSRTRSNSGETIWPFTPPEIMVEEVDAGVLRGHAM